LASTPQQAASLIGGNLRCLAAPIGTLLYAAQFLKKSGFLKT
jgi:hypothetical protein